MSPKLFGLYSDQLGHYVQSHYQKAQQLWDSKVSTLLYAGSVILLLALSYCTTIWAQCRLQLHCSKASACQHVNISNSNLCWSMSIWLLCYTKAGRTSMLSVVNSHRQHALVRCNVDHLILKVLGYQSAVFMSFFASSNPSAPMVTIVQSGAWGITRAEGACLLLIICLWNALYILHQCLRCCFVNKSGTFASYVHEMFLRFVLQFGQLVREQQQRHLSHHSSLAHLGSRNCSTVCLTTTFKAW